MYKYYIGGLRKIARTHKGFVDLHHISDPMLGALGSHLLFSHNAIDAEELSTLSFFVANIWCYFNYIPHLSSNMIFTQH
jgi:hypothetical protein